MRKLGAFAVRVITYGTGLRAAQLNASASVPGAFTYLAVDNWQRKLRQENRLLQQHQRSHNSIILD